MPWLLLINTLTPNTGNRWVPQSLSIAQRQHWAQKWFSKTVSMPSFLVHKWHHGSLFANSAPSPMVTSRPKKQAERILHTIDRRCPLSCPQVREVLTSWAHRCSQARKVLTSCFSVPFPPAKLSIPELQLLSCICSVYIQSRGIF